VDSNGINPGASGQVPPSCQRIYSSSSALGFVLVDRRMETLTFSRSRACNLLSRSVKPLAASTVVAQFLSTGGMAGRERLYTVDRCVGLCRVSSSLGKFSPALLNPASRIPRRRCIQQSGMLGRETRHDPHSSDIHLGSTSLVLH